MLVENLRKLSIKKIFEVPTFKKSFPVWKEEIKKRNGTDLNAEKILNIGSDLREIFQKTSEKGRSQTIMSSAGAAWECLVAWYLNLCLANSRGVVFKFYRDIIPQPVKDSLRVKINNYSYLSETDLIGFVIPKVDKIKINENKDVENIRLFNEIADSDFEQLEVCVMQCKTNWNDSSQIPFLWNLLYQIGGNTETNIQIGTNNRYVHALKSFNYSFITMPSQKDLSKFKPGSVQVERVRNLTGGNYWGVKSKSGVASSIKEIIGHVYKNGFEGNDIRGNIENNIELLKSNLSYFNF